MTPPLPAPAGEAPGVVVDLHAEALLVTLVEKTGDIRVAFALLCARVTVPDVESESYEAALARAVAAYFGPPGQNLARRIEP